ncbi:MAG: tetratricopeptide repeat protein [Verrucomicrobia bacterium]|nr:tetratricopeptide repeat protein [Verrucomicrobiota bacterium]
MLASLSLWKKLALGLTVAVVVGVVGFGFLEGGLRLSGFGHSTAFFREERDAQGRLWWRENREVTAPYFPPQLIRRPQSIRLPDLKAANAYRIFVLGSSAAMGDPEPAFSLARQLELILRIAYPEIHFEVVNAGITAINSHVVRSLASDCAALQPDLFIVYEGNNEVIGPYGPGTVFSPFLGSSAAISAGKIVKSTRTGQLLATLVRRMKPEKAELGDWGGMQMFLKNEIDRDDPRLATTQALFRDNLLTVAGYGRNAGARVFLCTVLTNQKDFAPFQSRHRVGFTAEDQAKWQALFDEGRRAVDVGDDVTGEAKFRAALASDDHFAELYFWLGRLCLRQNRTNEARECFQQALDLDVLRFRTDSRLNQTIRGLVTEPGVSVVDLAAAAEKHSPSGVVGDEFLYEHVHLNFQGTYLMARELFTQVSADLIKTGKIKTAKPETEIMPLAEARRRLAYSTYEQAMIIKELQARFAKAPFTAQSDNDSRQKIYAQRLEVAMRLLAQPETREGLLALYEQALAQSPDDWMLKRNAGMALVALGLPERALPLLLRATGIIPDDADSLFALASAQKKLGQSEAAAKIFARLRALEPKYPGLP